MQIPDTLSMIAIALMAFLLMLWFSPYACKETAAFLLSHAEATETARKVRRRANVRLRKRFGLPERAARALPKEAH